MKKVLIITYYWPPSGGSGVQRWLKHVKYLPQHEWQPYVFTPENPSFEVKDQSLVNDIPKDVEIIKLPIWEPYTLLNKVKGKGNQQSDLVKKKKKGFFTKLLLWLRGNLFVPDPRKFWVKPSVKVLEDLVVSNGIDVIITTGPPHSMHLIGQKLRKKLDVKWIADFRDPWTDWELFDNFYLTSLAQRKHKRLEKKVLKEADAVLSVSKHYALDLEKIGGRKVEVITNGFDDEEFAQVPDVKPEKFIIRHIGVVDELRDPRPVLEAVESLAKDSVEVEMEFIGNVNETLKAEVEESDVLKKQVSFKPYVPHSEVLELYRRSAVLLLVLANSKNSKGNIPGKLFEYLASERSILAVGDTSGDSAGIIASSGAGIAVERNDVNQIKQAILSLKEDFESNKGLQKADINEFSRRSLTHKLVSVLNTL